MSVCALNRDFFSANAMQLWCSFGAALVQQGAAGRSRAQQGVDADADAAASSLAVAEEARPLFMPVGWPFRRRYDIRDCLKKVVRPSKCKWAFARQLQNLLGFGGAETFARHLPTCASRPAELPPRNPAWPALASFEIFWVHRLVKRHPPPPQTRERA
ncbi:hypothetical protein L1887_47858 [Cichorium endivia]|nr:hypothetical protein L1887_47858 [Cichorium endivia]